MPRDSEPGRPNLDAGAGWRSHLRRLRPTVMRAAFAMISNEMSMSTAGCAFYAIFALFPAITTLIFLYGLVFDPHTVEAQLRNLQAVVPPPAYALIHDRIHSLVTREGGTLQFGLIVSVLIAFWSASTGTKSMLSALDLAYGEQERRGTLGFQLIGLGMTLCGILAVILALAIMVGLPAVIGFFGLSAYLAGLIKLAAVLGLLLFIFGGLSLLYRFGPSRAPDAHHIVMPGAITATILWIIASILFSIYLTRAANYNVTYGPLAAVIAVMMWFYVSAYVILFGAQLNASLEHFHKFPT